MVLSKDIMKQVRQYISDKGLSKEGLIKLDRVEYYDNFNGACFITIKVLSNGIEKEYKCICSTPQENLNTSIGKNELAGTTFTIDY